MSALPRFVTSANYSSKDTRTGTVPAVSQPKNTFYFFVREFTGPFSLGNIGDTTANGSVILSCLELLLGAFHETNAGPGLQFQSRTEAQTFLTSHKLWGNFSITARKNGKPSETEGESTVETSTDLEEEAALDKRLGYDQVLEGDLSTNYSLSSDTRLLVQQAVGSLRQGSEQLRDAFNKNLKRVEEAGGCEETDESDEESDAESVHITKKIRVGDTDKVKSDTIMHDCTSSFATNSKPDDVESGSTSDDTDSIADNDDNESEDDEDSDSGMQNDDVDDDEELTTEQRDVMIAAQLAKMSRDPSDTAAFMSALNQITTSASAVLPTPVSEGSDSGSPLVQPKRRRRVPSSGSDDDRDSPSKNRPLTDSLSATNSSSVQPVLPVICPPIAGTPIQTPAPEEPPLDPSTARKVALGANENGYDIRVHSHFDPDGKVAFHCYETIVVGNFPKPVNGNQFVDINAPSDGVAHALPDSEIADVFTPDNIRGVLLTFTVATPGWCLHTALQKFMCHLMDYTPETKQKYPVRKPNGFFGPDIAMNGKPMTPIENVTTHIISRTQYNILMVRTYLLSTGLPIADVEEHVRKAQLCQTSLYVEHLCDARVMKQILSANNAHPSFMEFKDGLSGDAHMSWVRELPDLEWCRLKGEFLCFVNQVIGSLVDLMEVHQQKLSWPTTFRTLRQVNCPFGPKANLILANITPPVQCLAEGIPPCEAPVQYMFRDWFKPLFKALRNQQGLLNKKVSLLSSQIVAGRAHLAQLEKTSGTFVGSTAQYRTTLDDVSAHILRCTRTLETTRREATDHRLVKGKVFKYGDIVAVLLHTSTYQVSSSHMAILRFENTVPSLAFPTPQLCQALPTQAQLSKANSVHVPSTIPSAQSTPIVSDDDRDVFNEVSDEDNSRMSDARFPAALVARSPAILAPAPTLYNTLDNETKNRMKNKLYKNYLQVLQEDAVSVTHSDRHLLTLSGMSEETRIECLLRFLLGVGKLDDDLVTVFGSVEPPRTITSFTGNIMSSTGRLLGQSSEIANCHQTLALLIIFSVQQHLLGHKTHLLAAGPPASSKSKAFNMFMSYVIAGTVSEGGTMSTHADQYRNFVLDAFKIVVYHEMPREFCDREKNPAMYTQALLSLGDQRATRTTVKEDPITKNLATVTRNHIDNLSRYMNSNWVPEDPAMRSRLWMLPTTGTFKNGPDIMQTICASGPGNKFSAAHEIVPLLQTVAKIYGDAEAIGLVPLPDTTLMVVYWSQCAKALKRYGFPDALQSRTVVNAQEMLKCVQLFFAINAICGMETCAAYRTKADVARMAKERLPLSQMFPEKIEGTLLPKRDHIAPDDLAVAPMDFATIKTITHFLGPNFALFVYVLAFMIRVIVDPEAHGIFVSLAKTSGFYPTQVRRWTRYVYHLSLVLDRPTHPDISRTNMFREEPRSPADNMWFCHSTSETSPLPRGNSRPLVRGGAIPNLPNVDTLTGHVSPGGNVYPSEELAYDCSIPIPPSDPQYQPPPDLLEAIPQKVRSAETMDNVFSVNMHDPEYRGTLNLNYIRTGKSVVECVDSLYRNGEKQSMTKEQVVDYFDKCLKSRALVPYLPSTHPGDLSPFMVGTMLSIDYLRTRNLVDMLVMRVDPHGNLELLTMRALMWIPNMIQSIMGTILDRHTPAEDIVTGLAHSVHPAVNHTTRVASVPDTNTVYQNPSFRTTASMAILKAPIEQLTTFEITKRAAIEIGDDLRYGNETNAVIVIAAQSVDAAFTREYNIMNDIVDANSDPYEFNTAQNLTKFAMGCHEQGGTFEGHANPFSTQYPHDMLVVNGDADIINATIHRLQKGPLPTGFIPGMNSL